MERLKHYILYLVIALAFFFNIERLDFNGENVVNIHSFVYLLAVSAIISIIVLPVFMRLSAHTTIIAWLSAYVTLHLFLFKGQGLLNDIYVTVTEIGMLIIFTAVAHKITGALQEFKQAVESMAMTHLQGTSLLLDEAGDFIRKEMRRSRQYQRSLSVIVATPDFNSLQQPLPPLVQEVQNTIAHHFTRAKLAKLISKEVQLVNTVLEDRENDRFIIVCPEADEAGVAILAEKIGAVIKHHLNVDVRCGTASFPHTALTFEELIAQAEKSESSPAVPPFWNGRSSVLHAQD